ncbi:uncharacterized protein LOC135375473 isoform X2 [Ornithodoros turicata]|uniref:uncharacterized protein LOC135375473 isoform X2 n=1 Tax=Ornithodoros turicata TaxID=34597 RepID=UPI003138F4DE
MEAMLETGHKNTTMGGVLGGLMLSSSTMHLTTTPVPWEVKDLQVEDERNKTERVKMDFRPARPLAVMLACLFFLFLAVGIPTLIQKKRREARERRQLQGPHENYGTTRSTGDALQRIEENRLSSSSTSDSKD